ARSIAALATVAASCAGGIVARLPPKVPIAVRAPPRITMSLVMDASPCIYAFTLSPARYPRKPAGGGGQRDVSFATVRRHPIDIRPHRHNAGRVYRIMALVIVPGDMVEVHRLRHARVLVQLTRIAPE